MAQGLNRLDQLLQSRPSVMAVDNRSVELTAVSPSPVFPMNMETLDDILNSLNVNSPPVQANGFSSGSSSGQSGGE